MEKMTSRLAAAAVVAGVAVLGAGCAANAAAPAGGHPSAAAAASPALPNPFTITARYSAKSLGLDHPDALAVGPDGNLYVTDLSQRVTVISPGGKVLRRWGKPGTGPGEFKFIANDPTAPTDVAGRIAVGRNGMVYVSDSGNDRVQVFTPQGRFIRQFGSYGSGKGQFFFPADLAVDGSGNVYVADDQSQTLAKFSPAGKVIWQIGGSASSDPDLLGHQHLASIDAHGRLVTVNDDQGRVLYVDPSGHKVDAFSPDSSSFFERARVRGNGRCCRQHVRVRLRPEAPRAHAGLRPGAPADREMAGLDVLAAHLARLRPERRGVRTRHGRVHPPAPHHAAGGVTSC